ncbi:hypothetical protein [Nonomuraea sp. LPB2021202275-12-8]|uniref:hypothetical protein n=1 Tax=Nonomuraea sp. LPB2021202275-12-8 TaxID=3120159 RepID=UPI00300C821F
MLDVIDDPNVQALRVEGAPGVGVDRDSVDFDIIGADESCLLAVQVKSKAPGGHIYAPDILEILISLIKNQEARSYQLMTNALPTEPAERMASFLRADIELDQLRDELSRLLSRHPSRLAQLESLSRDQLDRLMRCTVTFDRRDDIEIREALRERLRLYRNHAEAGLGQKSAGLLSGYLVSEMLRKAADESDAIFTTAELRSHVLIDGEKLALLGGRRDWGVVVGAMPQIPDVTRNALLRAICEALPRSGRSDVRRVVLVGPSGIGKSSLAAGYVADRADSYDWIFWMDGESEDSLLASYARTAASLNIGDNIVSNYALDSSRIRDVVHSELSRLTGRWAIVFDNVRDSREVEPWVPRVGNGDVLLTLIDETARHGPATVLQIGVMEPHEARELICRRLNIGQDEALRFDGELRRLAEGMSYWPLALELSTGYISTCGIRLEDVDDYLDRLRIRSLADADSLPPGYPRTLAAALFLCLDQLEARIQRNGVYDYRPHIAFGMITNSAYLASHQLPVHMVAAAFLADPSHTENFGPVFLDPSEFNLAEVVRELRRFSLVAFDEDLQRLGNVAVQYGDRTLAINSIIQDLIRVHGDFDENIASALNRLANHVERWLNTALNLNLLERASVVFNHAMVLAGHLLRLNIGGSNIPLFYGNLATACRAGGDTQRAEAFLQAELYLLQQSANSNELLTVQAELQLIDILFDTPTDASINTDTAAEFFEHIYRYAQSVKPIHPHAASKLAIDARVFLERPLAEQARLAKFREIYEKFSHLIAELGPSPYSRTVDALSRANELISNERFLGAEKLCRQALRSDYLAGSMELEARRVLVESLTRQHKWISAQEEFLNFKQKFGSTKLYPQIVRLFAHNVGHACALAALTEDSEEGARLLGDVLSLPLVCDVLEQSGRGVTSRLRLLASIRDLISGRIEQAETILLSISPGDLQDGRDVETQSWGMLWQMTRLALFRMASVVYLSELADQSN